MHGLGLPTLQGRELVSDFSSAPASQSVSQSICSHHHSTRKNPRTHTTLPKSQAFPQSPQSPPPSDLRYPLCTIGSHPSQPPCISNPNLNSINHFVSRLTPSLKKNSKIKKRSKISSTPTRSMRTLRFLRKIACTRAAVRTSCKSYLTRPIRGTYISRGGLGFGSVPPISFLHALLGKSVGTGELKGPR